MAENDNDLNTDQVVTDQDLNNADVVDQQDLTDQSVTDQNQDDKLADGTSADKTVKYSEMQKQVEARKLAEEQTAHAQRQLELMQAKEAGMIQSGQNTQVSRPQSTMEQAMQELGLTADDLYGENLVNVQRRKDQLDYALNQQSQANIASNQFVASHPDAAQVIGSVNPITQQFAPSVELSQILTAKPHLAGACNSLQGAYDVVMEQRKLAAFEKKAAVNTEHQNRANADVVTQPLGGSAAGGAGGVGTQGAQSLLTREQTLEIERKLAAGELV